MCYLSTIFVIVCMIVEKNIVTSSKMGCIHLTSREININNYCPHGTLNKKYLLAITA